MRGSLFERESLLPLLEPDCVVVNLAYLGSGSEAENLLAAQNLIAVCRERKVRRIIHCSTAVVVGQTTSNVVTEQTPPQPQTAYELAKYKLEKLFLEQASDFCEVVLLRPTAVFGPGGKNLLKLADDLNYQSPLINYLKSSLFGKRRMNLVSIDNVIAALELLIFSDKNLNRETFIISDDEFETNNFSDVETFLLKRFGKKRIPRLPIPDIFLTVLLKFFSKTNVPRRLYDSSKIKSLGLQKPLSFNAGLEQFAQWYGSRENS